MLKISNVIFGFAIILLVTLIISCRSEFSKKNVKWLLTSNISSHLSDVNIKEDSKIKNDNAFNWELPKTKMDRDNISNHRLRRELFPNYDGLKYLQNIDLTILPGYREDDDFENWTPPENLQRDFPTYMAGFDINNQPVWVREWGQWRFEKYSSVRQQDQERLLFDKYVRYLNYAALKSQAIKNTKENPIDKHVVIFDLERLQLDLLTNRKVVRYMLKLTSDYRRYYEKHISKIIAINVNAVGEVLLNLMRPYYLRILDRIEVYGTNRAVWIPQLLKHLPKDQIPEWYGGNKGFKPVLVIG